MCLSSTTYVPLMPITSYADIRIQYQYIYLIWLNAITNVTKSTGIHTFDITYICPWTNMPITLHIYVPLNFYCSLHMDHSLLHTPIEINKLKHLFIILLQNMCQQPMSLLECHMYAIYQYYLMCINGESMLIYATYELTDISHVAWSTVHRWHRMMQDKDNDNATAWLHILS